jgi:hypothetical protein
MNSPAGRQPGPITDWAGRLTLMGAEVAYVGLAVYLAWITFGADANHAPSVSATVSGATGALAAAFGVGYATVVDAQAAQSKSLVDRGVAQSRLGATVAAIGRALSLRNLLGAGVLLYMLASMLLGVAYVTNSGESPAVVRTIAVAFGGYVISFVGLAYKGYR